MIQFRPFTVIKKLVVLAKTSKSNLKTISRRIRGAHYFMNFNTVAGIFRRTGSGLSPNEGEQDSGPPDVGESPEGWSSGTETTTGRFRGRLKQEMVLWGGPGRLWAEDRV